MDKTGDRELVRRCVDGDAVAWNEFVDRFSGLVYWAIKRKLYKYDSADGESDVEEIYQRVMASIWGKRSLGTVRDRDNISPWLVVLTSNIAIDFLRKRYFEESMISGSDDPNIRHQDPEEPEFDDEYFRLLEEAMKLLNKRERTYLRLTYSSGKKHKEIARIFNTSEISVSVTISRVRSKIKRFIKSKR